MDGYGEVRCQAIKPLKLGFIFFYSYPTWADQVNEAIYVLISA